jgi:hypothetical protein
MDTVMMRPRGGSMVSLVRCEIEHLGESGKHSEGLESPSVGQAWNGLPNAREVQLSV